MERAISQTTSIAHLNRHLAAVVVLQDRIQQSPRHLRGQDFIMVDDLCDRLALLMQICTSMIVKRVSDLGGVPHWSEEPAGLRQDLSFQNSASGPTVPDDFAQLAQDALAVARAYGKDATPGLLAALLRDTV